MSTMNLGLSALMEAINQSEVAMEASELLFESFEDTIDDDIKIMVGGDGMASLPEEDNDMDADMAGLGIDNEDEEKYKKLVALIPEDGDDAEETADELAESLMMEADNLGLYF